MCDPVAEATVRVEPPGVAMYVAAAADGALLDDEEISHHAGDGVDRGGGSYHSSGGSYHGGGGNYYHGGGGGYYARGVSQGRGAVLTHSEEWTLFAGLSGGRDAL